MLQEAQHCLTYFWVRLEPEEWEQWNGGLGSGGSVDIYLSFESWCACFLSLDCFMIDINHKVWLGLLLNKIHSLDSSSFLKSTSWSSCGVMWIYMSNIWITCLLLLPHQVHVHPSVCIHYSPDCLLGLLISCPEMCRESFKLSARTRFTDNTPSHTRYHLNCPWKLNKYIFDPVYQTTGLIQCSCLGLYDLIL